MIINIKKDKSKNAHFRDDASKPLITKPEDFIGDAEKVDIQ
jgi:hypothetical protein